MSYLISFIDKRAASLAQLFHSGVIFLGFRQPRRTTLDDVLPTRPFRAKEAAVIALRIIKGLKELHEAELVHGNLTTKSVLVQFKKNVRIVSSKFFAREILFKFIFATLKNWDLSMIYLHL